MLVDEGGGTAQPLSGASGNGAANYYPSFSPDGRWVAFTLSRSGTTYGAMDAQIRLAAADGSGTVMMLPQANAGGAASFPTWSADGTLLSFSKPNLGTVNDWDIWYVPINSATGVDGAPVDLVQANTPNFDHIARWSP
jgi:Tol biopolymer transport system component